MRCKESEFIENGFYHIFNHAVSNEDFFRDDDDLGYFISKVKCKSAQCKCQLLSWVLMPNHYHFLIHQQDSIPAYKIFSSAAMSYINYFNGRYKRKGRLFNKLQHRKIVNRNDLLQVCTYIHLNPVKDGLVEKLEQWKYSDYMDWIDNENNYLRDDILDLTAEEYIEIIKIRLDKYFKK